MELPGSFLEIKVWALLLSLPCMLHSQRITCPTPCDVGYTCAMVRHGTTAPTPGCISMEEAILLHHALNGGPSGPGTGITLTGGQQTNTFPSQSVPLQSGMNPNPIPGMSFLGGSLPEPRGFEQRFQQGLNRPNTFGLQSQTGFGVPSSFVDPQNLQGQAGFGTPEMLPGPGQFPGFQGPPTGFGSSGFMDPTGQFGGVTGPRMPGQGQGFGLGGGVDGGHTHSSHATSSLTNSPDRSNPFSTANSLRNTNGPTHVIGSGGGSLTSGRDTVGFPGMTEGCRYCETSSECPASEYCYYSPRCARRICQPL